MADYDSTQMIRDDRDLRHIEKEIRTGATTPEGIALPSVSAVYGIFLNEDDCLPGIACRAFDFLYLGKSVDLKNRGHFVSGSTSKSTIRRSLGSLLKEDLALKAYARGRGKSRQDATHFRFDNEGERRLTDWIYGNTRIGFSIVGDDDIETIEKRLIRYCEPILNLDGNPSNPHAAPIKTLRKLCADEAAANGPLS
jgi:hypothetical protein